MQGLDHELAELFKRVMPPEEFVDFAAAIETNHRSEIAKMRRKKFHVIGQDRPSTTG